MPSQSEETVIKGLKELCSTFPKPSKASLAVVYRETDKGGGFDRTIERAAVIAMTDSWKLETKKPAMVLAPGDEKALEYVRGVAASAAQSACRMMVIVDLPANRTTIYVLNKGMCFVVTAACGDPFAPEVIVLSAFRDDILLQSQFGRAFVRFYYVISPPVAAVIARSSTLRCAAMALIVKPAVRMAGRFHFGRGSQC